MTRKKLSFMDVKEQELTREELRNVMAGSSGYTCTCYGDNDYTDILGAVRCNGGNGFTCCQNKYPGTSSATCSF